MSKRLRGVIPEDDTSFQGLQFPVRKRKKPAERIEEIFCAPVDGFARWTGFRDEKLVWDEKKIRGLPNPEQKEKEKEEEEGNSSSLQRIFEGSEVSGVVYPLLIEKSEHPKAKYRSLGYLRELCETPSLFGDLKDDDQMFVGLGIRDLFLACDSGIATPSDRELLDQVTTNIDHFTIARHEGIGISFFPTHSQRLHRYVQGLPSSIDASLKNYFAQSKLEGTCVVFIDPEELSYHNFENILPVDCVFERNQNQSEDGDQQQQQLAFSLSDKKTFEKKEDVVSFTLTGSTSSLLDLEELNLYNPVLNEGSRGGKRFIFQSSLLSKALTEAVKETGHFEQSFRFVNYVFRLNKFEPSDRKFESHYDTPYYDRDNRHISRFTLLIYLTGGKGKPVLRIEDLFLDQIEKMTCVIFPQSLEHEGKPFDDGTKLFIRSELIFEDRTLDHNPVLGSIFSKAVYMTGESIFKKELSSYAQQYYDRVAGLHWNLQSSRPLPSGDTYMEDIPDDESEESESEDQMEEGLDESGSKDEVEEESSEKDKSGGDKDISSDDKDEPPKNKEEKKYGGDAILHKEFSGVHFLTNGYDYWFTNKVDLKKACVVTLMDYFNCLVDDVPFRKLSYVEVVEPENGEEKEDWREVLHRLSARKWKRAGGDHPTFATTKKLFLPTSGAVKNGHCCPDHRWHDFKPSKCENVRDYFQNECVGYSKKKMSSVVLSFFGSYVCIHENQIVQIGDKIFVSFKDGEKLPPINFASCWNSNTPDHYIETAGFAEGHVFSIPPILVSQSDQLGHHLMFDFFRNDWMVRQRSVRVPIPKISKSENPDTNFTSSINPKQIFRFYSDNAIWEAEEEEEEVLDLKPVNRR